MFDIEKSVRKRRSVRTYDKRKVDLCMREKIMEYAEGLQNPLGPKVTFRLLDKASDPKGDKLGTYGIIKGADLVITGEGRLDGQTKQGKVISGIVARANAVGVPVIAVAGIIDMGDQEIRESGLTAAYPVGPRPETESDLEYAMRPEVASENIADTVAKALESLSPSLFRGNL